MVVERESWHPESNSTLSVRMGHLYELDLGGDNFATKVVVVDPLTTEAILGLDFLYQQDATINLRGWKLFLGETKQVPL